MSKNIHKFITATHLDDGRRLEMLNDPTEKKSSFVVCQVNGDGERVMSIQDSVAFPLKENQSYVGEHPNYYPLLQSDNLVKHNFIKLPSALGAYTSVESLFKEIFDHIKKYLFVPDDFITIATVYVMMSWIYEKFSTLPYLRFLGMFGVGKTRSLDVVGGICYHAMMIGGAATSAGIFRTVSEYGGTLVMDESDYRSSELFDVIVKILNAGHAKGYPVLRMEAQADGGFVSKTFDVFGPKIIASRERYSDEALESRCITHQLMPANASEISVPVHLGDEFQRESLILRNKLLMFRFKNIDTEDISDEVVKDLDIPRIKQTFLALISTASLVSEQVVKDIVEYAKQYEQDLKILNHHSVEVDVVICLLELIVELSDPKNKTGRLYVNDVANRFDRNFTRDFNESSNTLYYNESKLMISPRRIGGIIRKLLIKTCRDQDGFYIPREEYAKVLAISRRLGISEDMYITKPENGYEIVDLYGKPIANIESVEEIVAKDPKDADVQAEIEANKVAEQILRQKLEGEAEDSEDDEVLF